MGNQLCCANPNFNITSVCQPRDDQENFVYAITTSPKQIRSSAVNNTQIHSRNSISNNYQDFTQNRLQTKHSSEYNKHRQSRLSSGSYNKHNDRTGLDISQPIIQKTSNYHGTDSYKKSFMQTNIFSNRKMSANSALHKNAKLMARNFDSKQSQASQNQSNKQWRMSVAFKVQCPFDISHISFSQRRYLGYRSRFEFDKKRILIASKQNKSQDDQGQEKTGNLNELVLSIVALNQVEQPFEIFRGGLSQIHNNSQNDIKQTDSSQLTQESDKEIILTTFMEDHISSFILIVSTQKSKNTTEFKILKLSKMLDLEDCVREYVNQEKQSSGILKEKANEQIKQGKFRKGLIRKDDNIEIEQTNLNPKLHKNLTRIQDQPLSVKNFETKLRTIKLDYSNSKTQSQTPKCKSPRNIMLSTIQEQDKDESSQETQIKSNNEFKLESHVLDLNDHTIQENFNIPDQPFQLEQFGQLAVRGQITSAQLFYGHDGNFLFTLDSNKQVLSLFIVRARMEELKQDIDDKMHPKVANFTMSKRCQIKLDYIPLQIDYYADQILVWYQKQSSCKIIDVYDKRGTLQNRMDIQEQMDQYDLQILSIDHVMFPKMRWSDRKIEEFERINKQQLLKKILIVGTCQQKQNNLEEDPLFFEDKNRLNPEETQDESQLPQTFIMLFNINLLQIENIQLLQTQHGTVTTLNFGPFDNGYILLGLSGGVLIALESNNLNIIMQEKLFDHAVTQIDFEPTNLVIVSSARNEVVALNIVKREVHYKYVDLGKKQFCTIKVPHQINNQGRIHNQQISAVQNKSKSNGLQEHFYSHDFGNTSDNKNRLIC
eukprot:403374647